MLKVDEGGLRRSADEQIARAAVEHAGDLVATTLERLFAQQSTPAAAWLGYGRLLAGWLAGWLAN